MIQTYLDILILFTIILLGYVLTRKKLFSGETAKVFSTFVMTISLPLSIFLKITESFSKEELLDLFKSALLPLMIVLVLFLISLIFRKILRVDPKDRGMFSLASTTSNAIFFGLPVVTVIFGDKGIPYALLYYIIVGTFFWSVGLLLLDKDSETITHQKQTFDLKHALKEIISPSLIAYIIGILFLLIGFPVPKVIHTFCTYIGSMTTPMVLLFTGIIISVSGFRSLKFSKNVVGVLISRFVIAPIVVFLLSRVIPASNMMIQVCLIQASLPVTNSLIVLADQEKADVSFATSSLTYSTIAYVAVIPVILYTMKFF